jgi:hypothetical protein
MGASENNSLMRQYVRLFRPAAQAIPVPDPLAIGPGVRMRHT